MGARTTPFGPFTEGMDNRARDFALPGRAFREAVNVDLPVNGQPRRRAGRTLIQPFSRAHSLFAGRNAQAGLCVIDGTLCGLLPNGSTVPLRSGFSLAPLSYAETPGRGIAFSDGQIIGRVVNSTVRPIGIAQAADMAVLTADNTGSLAAGSYEVAVSHVDEFGEESGVTVTDRIDVPDNGRVTVLLPRAVDPFAVKTRIYASVVNGGQDYLVGEVPVATQVFDFAIASSRGRRLVEQMFVNPLPAGDVLASHHGRLYSHVGDGLVAYTQAFTGQWNAMSDYLRFPEAVTIIAPVPGGVFFVADQVYWFAGETPSQSTLRVVAEARGTRGTLCYMPDMTQAMWYGSKGAMIGAGDGGVTFPQEKHIEVGPSSQGAALYREEDGLHQYVVAARNPGASVAAARSYFTVKLGSRENRNEL